MALNKKVNSDSHFNLSIMNDANMMDEQSAGFCGADMTTTGNFSHADGDNAGGGIDWTKILGTVITTGGSVATAALTRPDITNPKPPQPNAPSTINLGAPQPKSGLSTGMIIGIAAGGLLLLGGIILMVKK